MDKYLVLIPYLLVMYVIYKKLKKNEISKSLESTAKIALLILIISTILMAVFIYFDRYELRNLMIIIPIIFILGYAAFYFLKDLILFSVRSEGTFKDFEYEFASNKKKFYNLKFSYFHDGKIYESLSNDQYLFETVEFRYRKGEMYRIYLNKDDNSKFTLNRLQYAYYFLTSLIPCLGLIVYGITLIF